tara:strand:- start:126 stop:350 length:225 start_codon:yes stop_codon:yes gene_type:complete
MNTQESNRLIAEFMGHTYVPEDAINYMEWNELMPVVEKIGNENNLLFDIEETYGKVIEHIQWYNTFPTKKGTEK